MPNKQNLIFPRGGCQPKLYEADPNNVFFKNGLAISYSKLDETHTTLGNSKKALELFEEYTKLKKELYEADPNNVSFKTDWLYRMQSWGRFLKIRGKMIIWHVHIFLRQKNYGLS